jgi:ATP-binding cassette subfamily B protein
MSEGIVFDGVSFTYPGAGSPSLRHVNLHLRPGSIVAIVGDNGAGKTTLVKLLCRFYDPTAGAVLVDGVDLREIDPEHWRSALTATFQDHLRLELRARETIGLGDLDRRADDDALASAVLRAGADDVIASLPEGLDTQLGNRWRGAELSGGQWQKLSLGRGMMRNAPLVTILDEPTSALDALTEQELFERFAAAAHERRERGAITILVSHRFSTVRNADLIVVFADGAVVELGTHEDLITARGQYAELFTLQARSYR